MDLQRGWLDRFTDSRGRRVVFVSHCLLNENTRYLGGARRAGAVTEILEPCLQHGIGLVQMACPEQKAWGGVLKRRLLWFYGSQTRIGSRVLRLLLSLIVWHTRRVYRKLAVATAKDVKDYRQAGCAVLGIVGVDGSPSCGVNRTLCMEKALDGIARLSTTTASSVDVNRIVTNAVCEGPGIYTALLREALSDQRLSVPFEAHDLILELEDKPLPKVIDSLVERAVAPTD